MRMRKRRRRGYGLLSRTNTRTPEPQLDRVRLVGCTGVLRRYHRGMNSNNLLKIPPSLQPTHPNKSRPQKISPHGKG